MPQHAQDNHIPLTLPQVTGEQILDAAVGDVASAEIRTCGLVR